MSPCAYYNEIDPKAAAFITSNMDENSIQNTMIPEDLNIQQFPGGKL